VGYCLADGLSFALVDDQVIFLDITKDHYFTLPALQAAAMKRVQDNTCTPDDEQLLSTLVERGVLKLSGGPNWIAFVDNFGSPGDGVGALQQGFVDLRRLLIAIGTLLVFRFQLRRKPLQNLLADLAMLKAERPLREDRAGEISAWSRAFAAADIWLTPNRNCLSRSLALAYALARRGLPCQFLIGVAVNPFRAHSWVETDRVLLNDRADRVRQFVPLLRL
jgi:hypothetical protein